MPASFVNCDWGTTRLRLRTVRISPWQVTTEFRSLDGVASIAEAYSPADRPRAYRSLLVDGLQPLIAEQPERLASAPVVLSGMASSTLGWQELPYAELPLALDGSSVLWRELEPLESPAGQHRVCLISGVRSATDVMRGEETELIGLFSLPVAAPLADGSLVIKPGTHSKHLRIENGQVVDFQTFMTGELFEVLSSHSILQHSLSQTPATAPIEQQTSTVEETAAFRAGVRHASHRPLGAALFRVRTRQLLDGLPGTDNRAFLSGVLLGSELAYLCESDHANLPILLCATSPLAAAYQAALEELELADNLIAIPPEETEMLSARGQAIVWQRIQEGEC